MADREQATEHYDASNAVRLCDRCEDESGVSAGADAGDRACSICGSHDAPHVYPALPSQPTDDREGWLEVPDYRGGGVMGRRRAAPTDDREITDEMVERALAEFIVAMQRTGTTREGLRAALRAALNPSAPDGEAE